MNKRGSSMMAAIVVGVMIFMFGMLFLNFIKGDIVTARVDLGCGTDSISDGVKLTCLIVSSVVPYFIIGLTSVAGGIITARFAI